MRRATVKSARALSCYAVHREDQPASKGGAESLAQIMERVPLRPRLRMPGPLRPPTDAERAWVRHMAMTRTRVPEGVFRYRTMAEANADCERWHAQLVAATVSTDRAPQRG